MLFLTFITGAITGMLAMGVITENIERGAK